MKYIKLFGLIVFVIILTGCSKEYSLYINDNSFVEKYHMEINTNNEYSYILDGDFYPIHNDFVNKFEKNLKTKNNKKILDLKYAYKPNDFVNANSFNQCFDERNVIVNDKKYYIIQLSKPNGCMFNEDYAINIITTNKVEYNNADKVKGNKYTWYVKNDNRDSFNLEIKIEKGTSKSRVHQFQFIIYIVIVFTIVVALVAVYIFNRKRRKNNKF